MLNFMRKMIVVGCISKRYQLKQMLDLFNRIIENPNLYLKKYENLSKFSYEYDWNNVNKKLIDLLDEN